VFRVIQYGMGLFYAFGSKSALEMLKSEPVIHGCKVVASETKRLLGR